jgi:uncharacterized membrane protein YccC
MNFNRGQAIFSINSFIAAMLALWIGFSLGLPRPYWAMLTVYITSQPLTGALRSKALYRVLGTAAGGAAAIAIVPTFVNAPILLSLAMAAWVGFCLSLSLLDRTPRAYVFMLAGYTTAIIGFPSVNAPAALFDTALARVEEITLGIVCATLVHTIILPRDVGQTLTVRIQGFLKDGQTWIGDALAGRRTAAEREERRRLASDITELHIAASHLPFDTANLPLRQRTVRVLENRLAYMLPLISALEDRLTELGEPDAAVATLLKDTVAWAEADASIADQHLDAEALRARCRAIMPAMGETADWRTLLTINILIRLEELIQALQDSRDLAGSSGGREDEADRRVRTLLSTPTRRRLHLDPGMAFLSGIALMAAVLMCCGFWIFTAWPEGYVAAMMAAVFSSFFAAQDDPAPAIVNFLTWTAVSLPLAALYLFLILPAIDGFPMLVLVLAPALLVVGYFQASPRWNGSALALLLGLAGGIALQPTFSADLPEFMNASLAQIVGVAVALACTRLLRSVGAGWAARRILRRGWREVAALARRHRRVDADAWIAAMLDRVGLVTARIALAAPEDRVDAHDALADMRVGLNIIDLETVALRGDGTRDSLFDPILTQIAEAFEQRQADARAKVGPDLLRAIDHAIAILAAEPSRGASPRAFAALTGLRRNLFQHAAPFGVTQESAA